MTNIQNPDTPTMLKNPTLRALFYFFGTLFGQWVTALGVVPREVLLAFTWIDWSIVVAGTLSVACLSLFGYRDETFEPKPKQPPA